MYGDDLQVIDYNGSSTSVAIPDVWDGHNVTSIGDRAFLSCISLQEITIPASVISIDYRAFYNCTQLVAVTFVDGSSLQTIYDNAFNGCGSLQTVYYGGSQTQWSGVIVDDSGNYYLAEATTYYYSAYKPDGIELPVGRYWRWVDGKPTVWKEGD